MDVKDSTAIKPKSLLAQVLNNVTIGVGEYFVNQAFVTQIWIEGKEDETFDNYAPSTSELLKYPLSFNWKLLLTFLLLVVCQLNLGGHS